MPRCENLKPGDTPKYYKGDEPSPKGKGRCAGLEQLGVTAKGADGLTYIVRKDKNGVKSWKKQTDAKQVTHAKKKILASTSKKPVAKKLGKALAILANIEWEFHKDPEEARLSGQPLSKAEWNAKVPVNGTHFILCHTPAALTVGDLHYYKREVVLPAEMATVLNILRMVSALTLTPGVGDVEVMLPEGVSVVAGDGETNYSGIEASEKNGKTVLATVWSR